MLRILSFLLIFCVTTVAVAANDVFVPVYLTTATGQGKLIGSVHITQTDYGLLFEPTLHGLTPGLHDFDIHENASCDHYGQAAGGDLDPFHTNKHLGPYNSHGHLGDLPKLYVASDGTANFSVLAPRILDLTELKNRTLIIDANKKGDEESRIACGVIAS